MKKKVLLTALLLSALSINGHAYGAEVFVDSNVTREINNAVYNGYTDTGYGAAILNKGNTTIIGSEFTNNKSYMGAVYNQYSMEVKDSTFTGNTGTQYAGGLTGYFMNSLKIDNTTFSNNTSQHDLAAGALYVSANTGDIVSAITNSVFNDNASTNASGWGTGGAIGLGFGGLSIDNTEFNRNSSDLGGAILVFAPSGSETTHDRTLTITNSKFNENIATSWGGALGTSSEASMDTVEFVGNKAGEYGGAIAVEGNMSIKNAIFDGNKVNSDVASSGGAIYVEAMNSTINIKNATFLNNEALNTVKHNADGSAISVKNGTVNIIGSTFENNVADQGTINQYASRGGERVSVINIDESIFKNNEALTVGGVGIFNKGNIKNTLFEGNKATVSEGGAMFVGSEGAVAVLDNVTFKNNTSASSGGAIGTRVGENSNGSHNNNSQAVLNITNSTFEGNTAGTTGGAIDNHFYNENSGITNSTFTNNSAKDGGAIYNHGDLDNQNKAANLNITGGSFTGNTASGNGGAIYNQADATIKGVEFSGNKAESGYGGSIYVNTKVSDSQINDSTTTISESLFEGNSASIGGALFNHNGKTEITLTEFNNNKADFGGAIYSSTSSYAELSIKDSAFTGNTAKSAGAVDAFGKTTIENVAFNNNSATDANDDGGGALFLGSVSDSTLKNVTFDGNTSAGVGGAIATRTAAQGNNSALKMTITDASFTNNSAAKEGGAIYSAADVTINAQGSNVTFSGNTAADGGDIYMADANTELAVNIADGKTVSLDGGVSGADGYDVTVQSAEFGVDSSGNTTVTQKQGGTGTLRLDSYLKGADMAVTQATLALGSNANIDSTSEVTITDGGFDTANGVAQEFGDNIKFVGNVDVAADVDLGGGASDDLSAIIEASTTGNSAPTIVISKVNAIGNTTANNKTVDLRTALGLGDDVQLTVAQGATASDTLTPVRWLKGSIDETTGMVSYAPRGNAFKDFNPAVMAGPVAAQLGGFLSQVNSYNQAFMNMDMKMLMTREERQAMRMRNSYAATQTPQVFSPTYLPEKEKAGWVRPYASFEKVGLDGGPRINNVMYGSYFGADSDMYQLKNGAEAQFSVYAGYTGSHQTFSGNSIYQNGGTLGLTGIVYKDNFFTALTANTGASVADMSTAFGSEDMPMLMAGIASKTGYNWELAKGKFIIQPSYLMSYTFVNAFDYTNAAGVRIESDPLNAIQIAPGVKFIGNLKNGWQPYVNLRMVWNLMGKSDFTAANTSLPELSVKPYFEYGLGLQKRWGDRFTGFGQAMLRAGGRTGVGVGFGFRWALGKAPTKSFNANDAKNIIQPTSVKLSNIK